MGGSLAFVVLRADLIWHALSLRTLLSYDFFKVLEDVIAMLILRPHSELSVAIDTP